MTGKSKPIYKNESKTSDLAFIKEALSRLSLTDPATLEPKRQCVARCLPWFGSVYYACRLIQVKAIRKGCLRGVVLFRIRP